MPFLWALGVDLRGISTPKWAVILKAWGSILRPGQSLWGPGDLFSGFLRWMYVFIEKSAFANPPPRHTVTCFTVLWIDGFFEFCMWWIFVIFSAQRFHSGVHFRAFLEALGLFTNSWKCVTLVILRGLTPFGRHLVWGLDSFLKLSVSWKLIF